DAAPWSLAPQQAKPWRAAGRTCRWVRASLDRATGRLLIHPTARAMLGEGQVAGWVYQVSGGASDPPALPNRCPRCDADERAPRSPLRLHRTGFQKCAQVLSTGLFRELEDDTAAVGIDPQSNRKLVVFTDSRQ